MMQILIIVPQHNEFSYFLDALQQEGCEIDKVQFGSIEGAKIHSLKMTVATGGHGKAQFAAQTQYLISHNPNTNLVVCAGAAGSLVKHLSLGDIVVATNTIEHDYKLRFVDHPLPIHAGHSKTIEQLRIFSKTSSYPFKVHYGNVASGDEDIISKKRATALREETSALCVAWEGSGGARAAALNKLPFVEVRVITDTADNSAAEDFQENLSKTVPNIVSFLVNWQRNRAV